MGWNSSFQQGSMSFEENFVAILSLVDLGSEGFAKITTMTNILVLSENIQNWSVYTRFPGDRITHLVVADRNIV